jgi:hypothetical protein
MVDRDGKNPPQTTSFRRFKAESPNLPLNRRFKAKSGDLRLNRLAMADSSGKNHTRPLNPSSLVHPLTIGGGTIFRRSKFQAATLVSGTTNSRSET